MYRSLFFSLLVALASTAEAKIKVSSLITDNMVLQQNAQAQLSGEATPGNTVKVMASWADSPVTATVANDGKWEVKLSTPSASYTEHTITFTEQKAKKDVDKVSVTSVLIGEVWLASGQSNMEMPLEGFGGCCVLDGTHDAINAYNEAPYVRMFTVKKAQSMHEQKYCEGNWCKTTFPETLKFSATAYYFAKAISNALRIPVGIVNASYGGAHVESWSSPALCETYPDIPTDSASVYSFGTYDFDRPLLMYNAMFCPVKHYTYKGIIWYQGCSNIGHADVYPERLANMVKEWRREIGCGDIPFYQVEIAPYEYGDGSAPFTHADNKGGLGALIREAQMKATTVIPNCGIVSTNDLVEPFERYNIHPRNKRVVGDRLSFLALNRTYGFKDVSCYGPQAKLETFRIISCSELPKEQQSLATEGKVAVIGFTSDNKGICRSTDVQGFELAGADRKFYPATVAFRWQTNEAYIYSSEVKEPVALRYCFRDWQSGNLLGGNELPLFPFRTDNW